MADVNGENQAVLANGGKYPPGEANAHPQLVLDRYTFPANAFTLNDRIKIGTIPKNSVIVGGFINTDQLGTVGIFSLGTDDDADGIVTAADGGGQAAHVQANGALLGVKVSEDTDVYLKCTEATDAALDDVIRAAVFYSKS